MSIYPNFPSVTELPLHCNHNDRKVARHLIRQLIFAGCYIELFDGEEQCLINQLKKSDNIHDILYAMSSTGEDVVTAFDKKGKQLGWFYLIYDNGSENDAMVCISDYLANQFCEEIYSVVNSSVDEP